MPIGTGRAFGNDSGSYINPALVVAGVAVGEHAIGMTVAMCIMAFGPITGASLNPARTLGPALASGDFSEAGIYLVAQLSWSPS